MNPLVLLVLAVIYALWPYDLLTDLLPGWGWIDDIVLLYLAWRYYRVRRPGAESRSRQEEGKGNADSGAWEADEKTQAEDPQDPYTVLSVSRDASPEEILQAYRKLAALYHPDKVQHLGEEFRQLAERRFKTIQAAYETLKRRPPR